MKKIITMAVLVIFGYAAAQEKVETDNFGFKKGNIFVGGDISVTSMKGTETDGGIDNYEVNASMVGIAPKIGYFFTNRLAAGAGLNYLSGKNKITEVLNDGTTARKTDKTNGFGGQVFARYYFLNLGKSFHAYSEVNAGFASLKVESIREDATTEGTMKSTDVGLDLGMNYFVTPKLAVSFTLSNLVKYSSMKIESADADQSAKSDNFSVNLNVFKNIFDTPTFGLLYKF